MESYIDQTAVLGHGVRVGRFSVIEGDVSIGNQVTVGDNVKIYRGSVIGSGVKIEDGAVIGKQPVFAVTSTQKDRGFAAVQISDHCSIGALAIVYAGSILGRECFLGDRALVRENCQIGNRTVIGAGTIIENNVAAGNNCKVQSGAYITAYTILEDHVFIGPMVITSNDNFMGRTEGRLALKQGPVIRRGARVGAGAVLLPGIIVEAETFIAAGAVVTGNTRPGRLYMGVPARDTRAVSAGEYLNGGTSVGNSAY